MITLFLDTEFNGFNGKLISMALVPTDGTREFYEVIDIGEDYTPWVQENVGRYINPRPQEPIKGKDYDDLLPLPEFKERLGKYIRDFQFHDEVMIIADWPEDLKHLCESLITGAGEMTNLPGLTMKFVRIPQLVPSTKPHHALFDARALQASYVLMQNAMNG